MGGSLSAQPISLSKDANRAGALALVASSSSSFHLGSPIALSPVEVAFEKIPFGKYFFDRKHLWNHLSSLEVLWNKFASATKGIDFRYFSGGLNGPALSLSFPFFNVNGSERRSKYGKSKGDPSAGRRLTNALLVLNVLFYAAQVASEGRLLMWGAKINSLINKGQLWRLVTSSMLHANLGHLMINCYSLNSVGPTIEKLCGPKRFLAVYVVSAITSSATSYMFCKSPAIGASGAIFGLVGSTAVFIARHRDLMGGGREQMRYIAQVILLNMAIGVLSNGIDNWGHFGGLIGGAATSWLIGPDWRLESSSDKKKMFVDKAPIRLLGKKGDEPKRRT